MFNGVHWPGTWKNPSSAHTYDHHTGMIQVMLKPPSDELLFGNYEEVASLDFTGIDMRLPMLVYVSREKYPEYEHHKKAGTLNALLRASAVMLNGPFILDLDSFQGRPAVKYGRQPGILTAPRELLDASVVVEAFSVISSWYEDMTEWGHCIGWIYGSESEDVVTCYRMHNRGWKSVYCVAKPDDFRRTAPMNLTDRLHQMLQRATGSVEIFFSCNNALLASSRMKILQRVANCNVGIYPFTSIFLVAYCFLPVLSLFERQLIVQTLNGTFLIYLLIITLTRCMLSILETKWSGITFKEWWRNEQFWLIKGTSAHLASLVQGLLKVIAGIELTRTSTLTLFSVGIAAPYNSKWTPLVIPPITIVMVNLIAIAVGIGRAIYNTIPQWTNLLGSVFFSFWVLTHLYPVAKVLMEQSGRISTIVILWCGLLSIAVSFLCSNQSIIRHNRRLLQFPLIQYILQLVFFVVLLFGNHTACSMGA